MKRRNRIILAGAVLLVLAAGVVLALRYFPFTRVVKMPAGSEKEFVDPQRISALPPNTLYYDFEPAPGMEVPSGFYKGIAHSGQYSVKAFGQNSFSVAVERKASEVGLENLKAVGLSAWVYVFPTDSEVKGNFVFTASNEVGVNVCWEAIWLVEPEIPRGKWFKISKYLDLTPVQFKPDYKIQVYFWNNSSADILVDDYFIAFGGPVDRRGDSARVDMTRPGGYGGEFNYPPFRVRPLERVKEVKPPSPDAVGPRDLLVAGDFFGLGYDALMAVTPEGRATLHAYCRELNGFTRLDLAGVAAMAQVAPVRKVMKGRFTGSRSDQVIVAGEKGWLLCSVNPVAGLCGSPTPTGTGLEVLWRSSGPIPELVPGDFNGDGRTEMLQVMPDGTWTVSLFQPGKPAGSWKTMAGGPGSINPAWTAEAGKSSVTADRFLPGHAADLLLSVSEGGKDGHRSWTLLRLDPGGKAWQPALPGSGPAGGRTIGLDTLMPADRFFLVTGPDGKPAMMRYNRDWRFDLKEIRFNDTTFAILSSIDFRGFDGNRNPKYYESLTLLPGRFLDRNTISLVVAGHMDPSRHYEAILPGFIDLYILSDNRQRP